MSSPINLKPVTEEDLKFIQNPVIPLSLVTEGDEKKKTPPVVLPKFGGLKLSSTSSEDSEQPSEVPLEDSLPPGASLTEITVAGKGATGVGNVINNVEIMETTDSRKARHDSVAVANADDLFTNYVNKTKELTNFSINPVKRLEQKKDLGLFEQSREGKAGRAVVALAEGTAGIDDLKYLQNVSPAAMASITGIPKLNDDQLRTFLDSHNAVVDDNRKKEAVQYYATEGNKINQALAAVGIDVSKLSDSNYIEQIVQKNKADLNAEKAQVEKQYPQVMRLFSEGTDVDNEVIAAFKPQLDEFFSKINPIQKKYADLNKSLGTAYGNAYAKANPSTPAKELGEKILQVIDPDLYKLGQDAKGDYGVHNGEVARLGINALYGSGVKGAVDLARADEKYFNKDYPESLIAETYQRLGAELYKGQNWIFNTSPSMSQIDEAAKQLPQENRDVFNTYIRPKEAKMIGTDIPMSGLVNKIGEGFGSTAINTFKGAQDLVGARSKQDLAEDILGNDPKFQDVGTYSPAVARLKDLKEKLKKSPLSVQELNEKVDLEKFTNVRSTAQEIIDGTGNLTGQVLFQALATRGLTGIAGELGVLKQAGNLAATGTAETIAATAADIGISKAAMNEVGAIGAAYLQTYDDGKKRALELFPQDEDAGKRQLYSQIYAGVTALSSRIFKDEKILDVLGKDMSPKIGELVTNLTEGKISREMFGSAISKTLKSSVDFAKTMFKENMKESTEEALESIGQTTALAIMAPAKYNYKEAYDEAVNTFTTTFMTGGLTAGFAAAGNSKSSRVALPLVTSFGRNEELTKGVANEINRQERLGIITRDEALSKHNIVQTVTEINTKNIPELEQGYNLSNNTRQKYTAMLLNESLLKRREKSTDDAVLKADLNDKIKASELLRSEILKGSLYVNDEHGIQTAEDASADIRPQPEAELTASEKAVELLKTSTTLNRMWSDALNEDPAELIKYIADQAQGRTASGTMSNIGDTRKEVEAIFSPEVVALAIAAHPVETTEEGTQQPQPEAPVLEPVKEDIVYNPKQDGDFIEVGPVKVIDNKDGTIAVAFGDGTAATMSREEFENNFGDGSAPVTAQQQSANDNITNALTEKSTENPNLINELTGIKSDRDYVIVPISEIENYLEYQHTGESNSRPVGYIDKLAQSIKENGLETPVTMDVFNNMGYISDGNHRVEAAKRAGLEYIPMEIYNRPYKFNDLGDLKKVDESKLRPIPENGFNTISKEKYVAEMYNKAKQDNSNSRLVDAVEKALGTSNETVNTTAPVFEYTSHDNGLEAEDLVDGVPIVTSELKINGEEMPDIIEWYADPKQGFRLSSVGISKEMRGQGMGKELYRDVNKKSVDATGRTLWTKDAVLSEDARRVWESLVRSGEAVKTDEGFRFKENTDIKPVDAAVDYADLFQQLKVKSNGNLYANPILGIPVAVWNTSMDILSTAIRAGESIASGISKAIDYVKSKYDKVDPTALQHVLESQVKSFNEKPVRRDKESMADYANRVLDWRRRMLANGTANQQVDALKNSQREMEFVKNVNDGINLLTSDIKTSREEFNKQLGLPENDYDTYVAALTYLKSSNKEAGKLLNSVRTSDTKNVAMSEVKLIRNQLMHFQRGYKAGDKEAKAQVKEIKDTINQMLADYNELGLLDGVTYTPKELLTLASRVNNVTSDTSFDNLAAFMQGLIDKAEYGRFMLRANDLQKQIKKIIKSKTISQNDIPVLKDLVKLDPVLLSQIGTYEAMLNDVANTRSIKEPDRKFTNEEIKEFTDLARQNEVDVKATNITTRFDNITNSQAFKDAVADRRIPPNVEGWARRQVEDVLTDTTTSIDEKKKKLSDINTVVGLFAKAVYNRQSATPQSIQRDIADNADNDTGTSSRQELEDSAKATQENVDDIDPDDLNDEQKKSLEILGNVDLAGRDSKTLKLFINVAQNVITNDDHSGVGMFEVIKKGQDNAKPLLDYLKESGRKILDRSAKTKVGKAVAKVRSATIDKSTLLTQITNNNAEMSTKVDNAVAWTPMASGFTRSIHDYDNNITAPLGKLLNQYPELHDDPDSIVRLSLYSFLNQSLKNSTMMERNAQLQRRLGIIRNDIKIKTEQGVEADRNEAIREQKILSEFEEALGKDSINELTKEQFDKAKLLVKDGEQEVYDLFKNYQSELQPRHEEIANYYLNKKYEPWDNYMKDSYRQLGSGLVDVALGDDAKLGFASADKGIDEQGGSLQDRTKGNPHAQKSGEPQRVLNLHFYNSQGDGVKSVLEDIHSLPERMAADEGFLNPQLKEALGNDNHALLKKSVTNYVKNQLGVGKGMTNSAARLVNSGLNVIAKLGTYRQLLSISAYVKQSIDTIIKTPLNLGKDWKMFYDASRLRDDGANKLVANNPISQRKGTLAGLNIISDQQLSEKDNIVGTVTPEDQGLLRQFAETTIGFVDRLVSHTSKGGVKSDPLIAKPIQSGDYGPAKVAWLAYYGQWLVNHGKYDSFNNIDWDKEAESQDNEAAAYAEQQTSKKLNENTKAGRSELLNSSEYGFNIIKNFLLPFGSFNMHNWNVMVEDMKTLWDKRNIIDKDYRTNEGYSAAKSLVSTVVGESIFQAMKLGIRYSIAKYGLTAIMSIIRYMADDDDKDDQSVLSEIEAMLNENIEKQEKGFWDNWRSETVGNLFLGGFGNGPQQVTEELVNWVAGSEFFNIHELSANQKLASQGNIGMFGAAMSGLWDLGKDAYRALVEPKNKYGVDVDVTPTQKRIIGMTFLTELLTLSGYGDADLNRGVETIRRYMDKKLDKDYGDAIYTDINDQTPRTVTVSNQEYELSPEQQDFYMDKRAERLNQQKSATIDESIKKRNANRYAKEATMAEFGSDIFKNKVKKKN